jgi:acyl dehydratase
MGQKLRFDQVAVGDEIPALTVESVSRMDFVRYAGASGDFVPLHYDQTFVEAVGIPTVFAQGMFTAGLLSRCLTDYAGVGQVRRFRVRFTTRVWPGDTVTCRGKITKKYQEQGENRIDGELEATNQKGEVAVKGSFVAAVG